MKLRSPPHMEKIKSRTAVFAIIICLAGLAGNVITDGTIINRVILIILTGIFTLTFFIKHHRLVYMVQILMITGGGISTVFFCKAMNPVGDLIVLTGILLAYLCQFIKKSYLLISAAPVTALLAVIRIVSGFEAVTGIITAAVIGCLVLFMWVLFHTELDRCHYEVQKNKALARISLNAGNFIHNLHLSTALKCIQSLVKYLSVKNHDKATEYAGYLEAWIKEKTALRHEVMHTINSNYTAEASQVDIHQTLDSVLTTLHFDPAVNRQIKVVRNFSPGTVFINAVPYEIYYILQNIIFNAVESMLKDDSKTGHTLSITTAAENTAFVVRIRDTGPGFPVRGGRISLESSGPADGFGIRYAQSIIRNYKGRICFCNHPAEQGGGAVVEMRIPAAGRKKGKGKIE